MRMWMIPPKCMCKTHIAGEHGEIHKFKHSFEKQQSMDTRIAKRQIFPALMQKRHNELAMYLNHNSPYTQPDIDYIPVTIELTQLDIIYNIAELYDKCEKCRALIQRYYKEQLGNWSIKL